MHSRLKVKIMKYQIGAYSISIALSNYLIKLLESIPYELLLKIKRGGPSLISSITFFKIWSSWQKNTSFRAPHSPHFLVKLLGNWTTPKNNNTRLPQCIGPEITEANAWSLWRPWIPNFFQIQILNYGGGNHVTQISKKEPVPRLDLGI